jgi:hypothetical protein
MEEPKVRLKRSRGKRLIRRLVEFLLLVGVMFAFLLIRSVPFGSDSSVYVWLLVVAVALTIVYISNRYDRPQRKARSELKYDD